MKPSKREFIIGALALTFATMLIAGYEACCQSTAQLTPAEAQQIAEDAYIYGYPLVTMEYTRRVMTNVRETEATRGPMGHFIRVRAYPTAAYKDVTAPNADTLYTTVWIDVKDEECETEYQADRQRRA